MNDRWWGASLRARREAENNDRQPENETVFVAQGELVRLGLTPAR